MKHIILCADDYGLNDAVSQAIRALVEGNRLSAVGCMVNFKHWYEHAHALRALSPDILLGLHFNLTEGPMCTRSGTDYPGLKRLLTLSHCRLLKINWLRAELRAQLQRFHAAFSRWPDFIDGHQHIHQFPQIRTIVLEEVQALSLGKRIHIRSTYPGVAKLHLKSMIIALTGGVNLSKQLKKAGFNHNAYFSGIYDFNNAPDYREFFTRILRTAPDNTLIMCHPGNSKTSDSIASARFAEFAYFNSAEFIADCHEYKISI